MDLISIFHLAQYNVNPAHCILIGKECSQRSGYFTQLVAIVG